ncbi:MAG: response regulator [Alteromonadales bacterium]|nr:response regulator [Alteromonadales bacterium]
MFFLNKLKSKSGLTYLVLLLGFLFSLLININFVSERAVLSLTQLQENHTKLQAQSTFENIQQFVENRVKLLTELGDTPIVISSVMGVGLASESLTDLLKSRKILGSKEKIYIADFTGELIYPKSLKKVARPPLPKKTIEQIIKQELPLVLTIIKYKEQHYFSISQPVKYNGHIEGIINFEIVSHSIEKLLAELIKDNDYAISFVNNSELIFKTAPLNDYSFVSTYIIAGTAIELNFYTSTSQLQQEKEQYVWQIGSTLTVTTLCAFVLLAFLIRSLLINPLEKLEVSERKIKQSEERYQLAIQGSNDGIWDWNIEKNDIYLSPRLSRMIGYEKSHEKQLINADELFLGLIHPDDEEKSKHVLQDHFKTDIPLDFELRMRVANGDYRYFRVRGIAQKGLDGKAARMAGSLSDVTEIKNQSLALKKALEEAKGANIAKSDFLANMSHEIRTPMNGVLGALQVLKQNDLSDKSNEIVEMGITSSKNLLSIINDILDLSKIESNNISLELLPTNIVALFQSIIDEQSLVAEHKKIDLVFSVQNCMHAHWLGDPVRLRQIFLNLISNAVKFTLEGAVNIELKEQNNTLVFEVRDTGIGISKVQIEKLFNRFEQADSTTTRNFGGTGLGLPIAKKLANLMGGDITVTSKENIGSTFSVVLPLKRTEFESNDQAESSQVQMPLAENLNILLVEDNRINQTVFSAVVKPTKATIHIANDGIEAVGKVGKVLPDMIFMDIQMPNMDGVQACEIIKVTYPNIPIFALTANIMKDDIIKYKQVGFDYCLGKPIDVNEVYRLIQSVLYQFQ